MGSPTQKPPTSSRKIAANRANARKSTGPKSSEGKRAVRNNALKHGMYSTTNSVVLPIDDPRVFHAVYCQWRRLFTPRDYEEHFVLESFVAAAWRYTRQLAIEKGIFTAELKLQNKLRAEANPLQPDPSDPMGCLTYAFRGLFSSSLAECNRQILRLERSWMKLLDLVKKLHKRPDSEITEWLSPEMRQPPPVPEVDEEAQPEAAPGGAPKNEKTKPPQTPFPDVVRIIDDVLSGRKPGETASPKPGDPPQSEPRNPK